MMNDSKGARAMSIRVRSSILRPAYFREVAAVVEAGGSADLKAIAVVMQRHGLTPAL